MNKLVIAGLIGAVAIGAFLFMGKGKNIASGGADGGIIPGWMGGGETYPESKKEDVIYNISMEAPTFPQPQSINLKDIFVPATPTATPTATSTPQVYSTGGGGERYIDIAGKISPQAAQQLWFTPKKETVLATVAGGLESGTMSAETAKEIWMRNVGSTSTSSSSGSSAKKTYAGGSAAPPAGMPAPGPGW
jgi:hypothetical protein